MLYDHRHFKHGGHFRSGSCYLLRDIGTIVVVYDDSVDVYECSCHHNDFDRSTTLELIIDMELVNMSSTVNAKIDEMINNEQIMQ